jgi:GNAT superfamily N-acetyltransferase
VLVFYVQAESPPDLSQALVDYVFSELIRVRTLQVIEVRARDEAPGVRAAWQRHDFVVFERCRMRRPLGVAPLPVLPVPIGYRVAPWQDEYSDAVAEIAAAVELQGAETSRVMLDKRGQVVGYVAVSVPNGNAQIVDLAVLPAHRRRGVARALVVRSMTVCQRRGLDAVGVAITTRNPARLLYNQLGFRPTDCGEVGIWWQDGRQLRWRE